MNDLSNQTEDFSDIRDAVRSLCQGYPGEYWREKDRKREYPTEFVQALTDSGFLAVLIPEIYGGSELGIQEAAAILEEIHKSGCNGAACHAQMYIMGTLLRHGSEEQKKKYLPGIASGELRLQAFGVTEPGSGTDTTSIRTFAKREGDEYVVNGQKVWTSRAEHSDLMLLLARTTPKDEVTKRTDGLSVFLVDLRKSLNHGVTIRPISTMINHATTEVFIDDLRIPAEQRIGEEGKGFPIHPRRHECRKDPDRGRMHRGLTMVHPKGFRVCKRPEGVPTSDWPKPGDPVSYCEGLCPVRSSRFDGPESGLTF